MEYVGSGGGGGGALAMMGLVFVNVFYPESRKMGHQESEVSGGTSLDSYYARL